MRPRAAGWPPRAACCAAAQQALRPVLAGTQNRARISTVAEITNEAHALGCRGTFEWSVRRP